jgi:hypothetical protein
MKRMREVSLPPPAFAQAGAVAAQAWRRAGRALSHPVRSADFNRALREAQDYDAFRTACSHLAVTVARGPAIQITDAVMSAMFQGEVAAIRPPSLPPWPTRKNLDVLQALVFALKSLAALHHANAAVQDFFADVPMDDEDWTEGEEQAHFAKWKHLRLARRTWPSLPVEERELLFKPAFELVYIHGLYLGLLRQRHALWRFHQGAACRRHDALHGLCAPPGARVWRHCLPPLAYFCDCWIEAPEGGVPNTAPLLNGLAPHPCALFGFDKRRWPTAFLGAYMTQMQSECEDDEDGCGGSP